MTQVLNDFKAMYPNIEQQKGFLGCSISLGENPAIKISVTEMNFLNFNKNIKLPKDFDFHPVEIDLKIKIKINIEMVPLLPSVAPKSSQIKKTSPSSPSSKIE